MLYQNEKIQYEIGSSLQQKLVELFDSCMTRHKIFIASFGEQDKEQLKKKKKFCDYIFFAMKLSDFLTWSSEGQLHKQYHYPRNIGLYLCITQ